MFPDYEKITFRTTISKTIHQNFTTYDFVVYLMRTKLEIINKSVLLFTIISYRIKTYSSHRETRIVCLMYYLQKIRKQVICKVKDDKNN